MSLAGPLDREVRRHVYDVVIARALPPSSEEAAEALGVSRDQVRAAFVRLAEAHELVLQRETREVLMAMPFSAVETPFPTRVGETTYHGNCAWDALGIVGMLKQDARIDTTCGCCSFPMSLCVTAGSLEPATGVVHFVVPARRFWDNIVFT